MIHFITGNETVLEIVFRMAEGRVASINTDLR